MVSGYFIWWYTTGYRQAWRKSLAIVSHLADFFSLETLIKSWFSPWKNDVESGHNLALSDQVKIWENNLVSRLVGFVVRSMVILVALMVIAAASIGIVIGLGLWLIVPALVVALPLIAGFVVTPS